MKDDRASRVADGLRAAAERNRAIVHLVRTVPLEEWHMHPILSETVKAQGFDIEAAIVRRDARARKEADNT